MKLYTVCLRLILCLGLFVSETQAATHGMLIFLEGQEKNTKKGLGTITGDFSVALMQEASPLIASGTLIHNLYLPNKPENNNQERTALGFDAQKAKEWVIKEINPSLYLLFSLKYLKEHNISPENVRLYTPEAPLTELELQLGLKVNHLKTVRAKDVKRTQESEYASYFIDALWNKQQSTSSIFVTQNEYAAHHNLTIPAWVFYIVGHGDTNISICDLSLSQFKEFLQFLEIKITTKLLYYTSCSAAGVNSQLLYKNAENEVEDVYSFPIITQALTDAAVLSLWLESYRSDKPIGSEPGLNYVNFLNQATDSEIINYHALAGCFTPDVTGLAGCFAPDITGPSLFVRLRYSADLASMLPQIKFPGLPWFSVIDDQKVVSIGSVLAHTRKKPLDIATFFKKNKKQADPIAVLLYTEVVPFELIINTTGLFDVLEKKSPAIISMIPGTALHHIKQVSSTTNSLDQLLNSFVLIDFLGPVKIFLVDEITASQQGLLMGDFKPENSSDKTTLSSVICIPTANKKVIYFTYQKEVFKIAPLTTIERMTDKTLAATRATEEEKKQYESYCALFGSLETPVTQSTEDATEREKQESVSDILRLIKANAKAQEMFSKKLSCTQALKAVKNTFENMPNNSTLYIPKLMSQLCKDEEDETCWGNFYTELSLLQPDVTKVFGHSQHKIIRIGEVKINYGRFYFDGYPNSNIVIDISVQGTQVFSEVKERNTIKKLFLPKISFDSLKNGFFKKCSGDYKKKYEGLPAYGLLTPTVEIDETENEQKDRRPIASHLSEKNIALLEQIVAQKAAAYNLEENQNFSYYTLSGDQLKKIIKEEVYNTWIKILVTKLENLPLHGKDPQTFARSVKKLLEQWQIVEEQWQKVELERTVRKILREQKESANQDLTHEMSELDVFAQQILDRIKQRIDSGKI